MTEADKLPDQNERKAQVVFLCQLSLSERIAECIISPLKFSCSNLTVTRGEVGGGMMGGRVFQNNNKGHMGKTKWGMEAREGGGFG